VQTKHVEIILDLWNEIIGVVLALCPSVQSQLKAKGKITHSSLALYSSTSGLQPWERMFGKLSHSILHPSTRANIYQKHGRVVDLVLRI
jgi:hypothetical protein